MSTIIDLRSFKPSHASGLVFSIFEGLKEDESFRVLLDEEPTTMKVRFIEAGINDFSCQIQKNNDSLWEIEIVKASSGHHAGSCCGMCGQ